MTAVQHTDDPAVPAPRTRIPRPVTVAHGWLSTHDPGYGALRRAGRAALVMPAMLAFADRAIGNPAIATFAAFGSFAMLLLVDFAGPIRDRLRAQVLLGLGCVAMICLGTLVSESTWLSVVTTAAVAFVVLFAAVISSVLAGATTSLLLAFILPVSIAGPVSSIPDRVAGWSMAAAASLLAISLLWPAATRDPIRARAITACRAIATRLRVYLDALAAGDSPPSDPTVRAAIDAADEAVRDLYMTFFATPYRPTGLTTEARAIVRLVDDLRWCNAIVLHAEPAGHARPQDPRVAALKRCAADVLDRAAELLAAPGDRSNALHDSVTELRAALAELERSTTARLPADVVAACARLAEHRAVADAQTVIDALEPSFRAQELSFVAIQIAANTDFAAAAARRGWVARLLGRQPAGFAGALSSARERATAHLQLQSTWLHNSLRGATALAGAVLVADLSGVQHGFWVAFGTLSVLRSNALSTGQNTVRAVLGTTAGFVVGGALVYAVGTNTTVLWILLPFVVLFAGIAPAAISFAAGQAAFTLTLLILFNILAPAGWRIGLVRVEDVAIGGAVSLAAGVLFWPRGAGRALGRALGVAYNDCMAHLAAAVAFGIGCCDGADPSPDPSQIASVRAAAASRRLDDTLRSYLAERGVKRVPLADVTRLVTGVTALRLAGDAVRALWESDTGHGGNRAAARRELETFSAALGEWYGRFAAGLAARGPVPDPLPRDEASAARLVGAVGRDLADEDGTGTATGVRVVWTGDHLDAARRLQETLVEPARVALARAALPPS